FSSAFRSVVVDQSDKLIDSAYQQVNETLISKMESVIRSRIGSTDFPFEETRQLVEEVLKRDPSYDIEKRPAAVTDSAALPQQLWAYYRACTWIKRARDYVNEVPEEERICQVMYLIKFYTLKLRSREAEFAAIPDLPGYKKVTGEVESNDPEGLAGQLVRLHINCPDRIVGLTDQEDQQAAATILRSWEYQKSIFEEGNQQYSTFFSMATAEYLYN
ncbi:MAG: hypothetical protein AAFO69_02340, partial [Bacteroidota bacterium]